MIPLHLHLKTGLAANLLAEDAPVGGQDAPPAVHSSQADVPRQTAGSACFQPVLPSLAERQQMVDTTRAAIALLQGELMRGLPNQRCMANDDLQAVRRAFLQASEVDLGQPGLEHAAERLAAFASAEGMRTSDGGPPRPLVSKSERARLRQVVVGELQRLLSIQTAQGWQAAGDPWAAERRATPDAQFAALAGLQAYAQAGPAQRALADSLVRCWREGAGAVALPAGTARTLPDPCVIEPLAGPVNLLHIDALRDEEIDERFAMSLPAFGAGALLLTRQPTVPEAVWGLTPQLYLARSPKIDISADPIRGLLRAHPQLCVNVDLSVKGASAMMRELPCQVQMSTLIEPDKLQHELAFLRRWVPDMHGHDLARLEQGPARDRVILRDALARCESRGLLLRRPDFVANVRLLLRGMAADAGFRHDACSQIAAWSPVCADDWINCISTILSSHGNASPITEVREGAARMFWQSLLQEADRTAAMRDPALLPQGAWDDRYESLETETALMLRQAIDGFMERRFGMRIARHVPQLHADQSAVDEEQADAFVLALVERERRDGFPLARQFCRDSEMWKAFVATLPGVQAALDEARDRHMADLDERPQDPLAILRAYEQEADTIRARPLLEALAALLP